MRLLFILLFLASLATAHLAGGEDKTLNGYLVEFGFEPETLFAQQHSFLSFNLVNASSLQPINYSSAWIRISQGNDVVFAASNLLPTFGNVALTYSFPSGGNYVVDVEFKNGVSSIVRTSFEVAVAEERNYSNLVLPFLLGLVIGAVALFLFLKLRR